MVANPPLLRDILECAVAFVQEKLVRLALVELGTAVVGDAAIGAQRVRGVLPLHVVHDEEIEQASLFTSTQAAVIAQSGPNSGSTFRCGSRPALTVTSVNVPSPLLW